MSNASDKRGDFGHSPERRAAKAGSSTHRPGQTPASEHHHAHPATQGKRKNERPATSRPDHKK